MQKCHLSKLLDALQQSLRFAGIGFTTSIFSHTLAFEDQDFVPSATGAILLWSFLSAMAGILLMLGRNPIPKELSSCC